MHNYSVPRYVSTGGVYPCPIHKILKIGLCSYLDFNNGSGHPLQLLPAALTCLCGGDRQRQDALAPIDYELCLSGVDRLAIYPF